MQFTTKYSPQAEKFVEKLDNALAQRLVIAINKLELNPLPSGIRVIKGERGLFRLRVGAYRVLYQIDYEKKEIPIISIGKREDIY